MTIYTTKSKLLLLCIFTIQASYLIILPMIPVVTLEKGIRQAFVGWFVSTYGVAFAIGGLVGGKLVIRYGQHRVLVASFFTFAITWLPIGALELMDDPTQIAVILLLLRGIQGLITGAARWQSKLCCLAQLNDEKVR